MEDIIVNLANHRFQDGTKAFNDSEVSLKHKNFIFAKNGSGKSTFTSIASEQFSDDYDVRVYNGFDAMLGENENLNAFALSVQASENEEAIKEKETVLKKKQKKMDDIQQEINEPIVQGKENIWAKLDKAKRETFDKEKKIEDFYTESAAKIKKMTAPQISKVTYYKRDFESEIKNAESLQEYEIKRFKDILTTLEKVATSIEWHSINLDGYLKSTNDILKRKVKEKTRIIRISGDSAKINFAQQGLAIHKHDEGEICAFCGNTISKETFEELESYFRADEVTEVKQRIIDGERKIDELISIINNVAKERSEFYPNFLEDADRYFSEILDQKHQLLDFCNKLKKALKEKDIFSDQEILNISVPANIEVKSYNELVEQNNIFGSNLDNEKQNARDKLRYHEIKQLLESFQYNVKQVRLKAAKEQQEIIQHEFNLKVAEIEVFQNTVNTLKDEIEALKPKAEKQAISHINEKLRGAVPWQLDYYENYESGYYWISQKCTNGDVVHRGVKELSTGEKNIIAFLYFLEKLEDTSLIAKDSKTSKVILIDDPMNSNDADMQYLIITELQKLYQGNSVRRFNPQEDYLVIMTHNIHFYLNVPTHGSFKDSNGRTKYDKSNFYHIKRGVFHRIANEKEDFKTNYDALWSELHDLSENGFENSMLNSMRRIIETYLEFNGIKQVDFYQNKEKYLKLFNVNSHSAIDDLSAEAFTESAQELVDIFHQIFIDNNAETHFNVHWNNR